jgi:murein DD-endopeptidase MepM/ murein hydrolase activator NlpD
MMNENKKSYDNIQTNQKKLVEKQQKLVISRLSLKDKLNSLVALQNDTIGKKNILNTFLNKKEIEQLALFDSIKKEQFFEESASNEIILILDQLEYLKQLQSSESSTFVFDKIEYDFIGSTSLQTPMPSYQISSDYGMRFHPVLQYSRMHNGVDLGGMFGEPIYSAGDGVVVFAGPASGFGNWIVLYHGTINDKEIFTIYGHMNANQIFVKSNQPIKKGEKIAGIGSAGTSTGPHLHFGLAEGYSGSSFNYVDPKKYIKFSPNQATQVQPVIPKIELKPVISVPVEPITTPVVEKEEPSKPE